jgi:hypothetical protein
MDIIQEGRVEGKIPLSLPFIKGDFSAREIVYSIQLTVYSLGKALRLAQGEGESKNQISKACPVLDTGSKTPFGRLRMSEMIQRNKGWIS